jgi:hypothetical protein
MTYGNGESGGEQEGTTYLADRVGFASRPPHRQTRRTGSAPEGSTRLTAPKGRPPHGASLDIQKPVQSMGPSSCLRGIRGGRPWPATGSLVGGVTPRAGQRLGEGPQVI